MAEEYVDQMSTVKFIGFPGGCFDVEDEQDVMLTDEFQGFFFRMLLGGGGTGSCCTFTTWPSEQLINNV